MLPRTMHPMHLRPLSVGEILDGAFTLYRRHFLTLFLTALLPNLPAVFFWLLLGGLAARDPGAVEAIAGLGGLLFLPYTLVSVVLVWGALMQQLSRAYAGEAPSLGAGYGAALRRFFPLVVSGIVTYGLMILGFLLCIVPGVIVAIVFFAVWPAVMIEGSGPFAAMSRSRALARGAWKRIGGVTFVAMLIIMIPFFLTTGATMGALGLEIFSLPLAEAVAAGGWTYVLSNVLGTVVGALTGPYFAGVMVLLYYDRRVRSEALDLEMAADALRPSAG
jgi:hypothetical protein